MRLYCTYFNFYRDHKGLRSEKEREFWEREHLQKNVELLKKMEIYRVVKLQESQKRQLINYGASNGVFLL